MWQYRHTDELYHSVINNATGTNVWRYRYSDELYHKNGFKYIDKVLTDRGWRYIYDKNEAIKRASRLKSAYDYHRRKTAHAKSNLDNTERQIERYNQRTSYKNGTKPQMTAPEAKRLKNKEKRDMQKAYKQALRQEKSARKGLDRAYRQVKRATRREKRWSKFEKAAKKVTSSLSKIGNKRTNNVSTATKKGKAAVSKLIKQKKRG